MRVNTLNMKANEVNTAIAAHRSTPAQESVKQDFYKESPQPLSIQCKLFIGAVNDPLEYEAETVADKVMSMQQLPSFTENNAGGIQRACADCKETDKLQRKPLASFIQRKESATGDAVASDAISNKINASKGNGSSMDNNTQSFMQSRFGTDFSNVKVHTGGEAIQMNRELNAKAFTVGNNIYFNEGRYNPGSADGKHLLAHELTHTVQQGGVILNIQEKSKTGDIEIIQKDDLAEATDPTLSWPVKVEGSQVFSCYGERGSGFHPGLDISQTVDSPVYAAAAGTIIFAGPASGYGDNFVAIKHNDTLVTSYGHMNSKLVKKDQKVSQGEKIGTVGNQGQSTGPHLHFNVVAGNGSFYNGNIDPLQKGLAIPTGVPNPHNCI